MMDLVVGGKFKLGRKIGSGSFGELHLGMLLQFLLFYIVLWFFVFACLSYYIIHGID